MGNMLFNMLQGMNPQFAEMIKVFNQFKNGLNPESAKQQVEQLLMSGKMSQEQFEQLKKQAEEYSQFLK